MALHQSSQEECNQSNYRMPMVSDAWYSSPTVTEKMRGHIERVRALREARLTTTHVVETFVRQRIIPLKRQDLAYTYTRLTDPNRESV